MLKPWLKFYDAEVPAELTIPAITIPDLLKRAVEAYPQQPACVFMGARLSYRTLKLQVDRLAAGLHVPLDDVLTRYVDREAAAEEGEWGRIKAHPCPFLGGKLCTIYSHRPDSCRMYPTFTPDFRWTLEDLLGGAGLCPIIYHVLDALGPVIAVYERPEGDIST